MSQSITVHMSTLCDIKSGKSDTKDAVENGDYAFFDRSKIIKRSSRFLYDCEALIIAGEGAEFLPKHYTGKFDLHQRAYALHNFKQNINVKYLFYYLHHLKEYLPSVAVGATVKSLRLRHFENLPVVLYPIHIQQRIVAKLDAIFAEIDKASAAAEANAKNAESLFQSYLTQIFEHEKDGWKLTNLKDIAEYFNGLTYSPKNVSDEGVVVLRSSNVQEDKILLNDIVRVNSPIKEKLYVKLGDILMCSRNGSQRLVGKTATIPNLKEKMTFGTFMMIVRSDSNFFIEWFFKSDLFKRQITSGENTMINQVTRYMLDKIVIPMPDLATQKSISLKISDLYKTSQELKLSYKRKVNELEAYKKSILTKAFSGDLIKD